MPEDVSRQQHHRRKRRETEKCANEGCPNLSGNQYRCDKCREAHRMYMRGLRAGVIVRG